MGLKVKNGSEFIELAPSQQEFDDFKESTEKELASLTFSDVSLNETRIKYLLKNVGTTLVDTTKQFVEKTKATGITQRMRGIASGNGVIVAVGIAGQCQYSNNGGETWTATTPFTAGAITAIAYGRNYFMTVDSLGKVFRSLNGQQWTEIEFINSKTINSIIYAGGRFVIVGVEGLIAISFNGLKFEIIDTGVSYEFTQITFGEGMYVACSADSHIMMSKNSIEWVDVSIAGSTDLYYSAGYGNGKFILGANAGIMRYSTDGITWQTATNNSTSTISYIRAITFIENVYYAVMYLSNGGGEIWVSQDGISWTVLQTITGTSRLWACCNYTDSKVIATGESGRVFVLDLGITWSYVYPDLIADKDLWQKNESILSDGSYVYGLPTKSGMVDYVNSEVQKAGGGTAENIITTSELTYPLTLLPNTFYKITATATAFTFTLGTPTAGIVNEYMLQITWDTTIGTVAFPSGIVWADTGVDIDDLELGYTYSVSILNGIGIIIGVEL